MGRPQTIETRKKIGEGVKRFYKNMSAEERERHRRNISKSRKLQAAAYNFVMRRKDVIKKALEIIDQEKENAKENDENVE